MLLAALGRPTARDGRGATVPARYEVTDGAIVRVVDHLRTVAVDAVLSMDYLGLDVISRADWSLEWNFGRVLHVTPTGWSRANAGGYISGVSGWDELYSKYRNRGLNTNVEGLRDQYICHQQIVAIRAPNRPTWNLDEWRPDVSYAATVNASCNPGGPVWLD